MAGTWLASSAAVAMKPDFVCVPGWSSVGEAVVSANGHVQSRIPTKEELLDVLEEEFDDDILRVQVCRRW